MSFPLTLIWSANNADTYLIKHRLQKIIIEKANKTLRLKVVLIPAHRLRRWAGIKPIKRINVFYLLK